MRFILWVFGKLFGIERFWADQVEPPRPEPPSVEPGKGQRVMTDEEVAELRGHAFQNPSQSGIRIADLPNDMGEAKKRYGSFKGTPKSEPNHIQELWEKSCEAKPTVAESEPCAREAIDPTDDAKSVPWMGIDMGKPGADKSVVHGVLSDDQRSQDLYKRDRIKPFKPG